MGKGNLAKVLAWETVIMALISIVGGEALGIALGKLFELLLEYGHGVPKFLPRQELHARKKHHGKTDQCNDRSVQHRNPVARNPENEQAEHDNNSLDFIGLNLLSCGSLFADTLKALVGNGFGFQNLSDKEPGDGNHHDNHRQRDDDPIEERDRRARSLLENIHCNNVERATCRRCHATRDGRNRDTNHQAASKIRF